MTLPTNMPFPAPNSTGGFALEMDWIGRRVFRGERFGRLQMLNGEIPVLCWSGGQIESLHAASVAGLEVELNGPVELAPVAGKVGPALPARGAVAPATPSAAPAMDAKTDALTFGLARWLLASASDRPHVAKLWGLDVSGIEAKTASASAAAHRATRAAELRAAGKSVMTGKFEAPPVSEVDPARVARANELKKLGERTSRSSWGR